MSDEQKSAPTAAGGELPSVKNPKLAEWAAMLELSEREDIAELLQTFSHDSTEDNAVYLVREIVRTALASQPAGAVPNGWKLVPLGPTREMLNAGFFGHTPKEIYERMLDTAPMPPAAPTGAALEPLDVNDILNTAWQFFSKKESPFAGGGTIVQGGIGSLVEFAHAIRSQKAKP